MDPLEFERYPLHEKVRVELIGKSYPAARIVAVVIESATSTAYSGLNGPLPQFSELIMSVCKSADRCMVMTAIMYLHGTLRLMRRYGVPFSCHNKWPMRQLTNILHPGIYIRESYQMKVLITNFGNESIYLPRSLKVGRSYEGHEECTPTINLLEPSQPVQLSPIELAERRAYVIKHLNICKNTLL